MEDRDSAAKRMPVDAALRERAVKVIPGGMYGHQSVARVPASYPQFMARGQGSHVWDVDGNEYIDLMCGYGPILLGHHHPKVDEAASRQLQLADVQNTPSGVMVDLAEEFTSRVSGADWAMFCKNGTDTTTAAVTIARAATGRRKVLLAKGAYHGSDPWCTPIKSGVLPEDRAHFIYYTYNDAESLAKAVAEAGPDLAGIVVSPIRHDLGITQELPDPAFAKAVRDLCDANGGVMILDDVRCGFRINNGHSWQHLGIDPDLTCWSKGIANGYALGAFLGTDALREAAKSLYVTGSFWFAAVSMAAALATLDVIKEEDTVETMLGVGNKLKAGLEQVAAAHDIKVDVSGPVQMPLMIFQEDHKFSLANAFTDHCIRNGVFLHPMHNWFLSSALTEADVDQVLEVADGGFSAVAAAR